MAVGGAPALADLVQESENIQAQNDEITVLQSIFEEENLLEVLQSSQELGNGEIPAQNMLKMYVPITCDKKVHVDVQLPVDIAQVNGFSSPKDLHVARSESGQRIVFSFEASYLPPVCLHVTLPRTYPDQDPPSYVLSCLWLTPHQLTVVCRELDRLWLESKGDMDSPGEPVLYTWLDWLREQLLRTLGIEDHISVTSPTIDEDIDDCRVVIETDDLNSIVTHMVRYNHQEEQRVFNKSEQECSICFDQGLGHKFIQLPECKHHVCRECLLSHCQLLVKEGAVLRIRCPMYECKAIIPPYVLKEVLTLEDFERFEELSFQKGLEVMGDITWCPRCNNPVIQEPEENLNLAHCTSCFFTFCTECMEKSHQGEKCRLFEELTEEEKKKVEELEIERKEIEADRKRKTLLAKYNKESQAYIKQMAKNCPKCRAPIMKIGGCNKVHCANCNCSMCYLCKKDISKEGYAHFNSGGCETFNFEMDVIDNTDIADILRMGVVRMQGVPRPKPKVPTKGSEIEDQLKERPELRRLVLNCFTCKQKNIKDSACNHIRCWNCKNSMCFYCRQRIAGPVGKHYGGVNSCLQHTFEPELKEELRERILTDERERV